MDSLAGRIKKMWHMYIMEHYSVIKKSRSWYLLILIAVNSLEIALQKKQFSKASSDSLAGGDF
jgi:hypothetical protein